MYTILMELLEQFILSCVQCIEYTRTTYEHIPITICTDNKIQLLSESVNACGKIISYVVYINIFEKIAA